MARRARLLIYEGSEGWMAKLKENEYVKEGKPVVFGIGQSIYSIELNPDELTLFAEQLKKAGIE